MNIRSIIKKWIPYHIIANRYDSDAFIQEYKKWNKSDDKTIDTSSKYKTVVSVQGFGFSGSGAVVDLLREYSECQVLGGVDDDSIDQSIGTKFGEFDFIRHSGGFYDIERHFGYNNIFINDGVINRYIKMVFYSGIYRNFPESHTIFFNFLKSISELHLLDLSNRYYNANLYLHDKKSSIFFLKDMSLKEYRKLSKETLNALFGCFYQKGKSVLVADQMCCDLEFDIERDKQYFDNLKTIIVYRDPRDVYYYAKSKNVEWIAHDDVDSFINWYNIILRKFNDVKSKDVLLVRFEDLVAKYEETVQQIEQYVGLNNHTYKYKNLDPTRSVKNVGIWKKSDINKSDFEKIKDCLATLCYK